MDAHLKPLFNRRLLRDAMTPYEGGITDEQRALAAEWAASVRSGGLTGQKEKNLQGLFLTRIFDRILGFRQVVAGAGVYHMKPEHALRNFKSSRTPDACLGFFQGDDENIRAVVELKAPGADLDAKQGKNYGNVRPVEQAFGYASKLDGCRWVIVSNFATIRLYRYGSGQGACHVFNLGDIADGAPLEELWFLLGRETLLAEGDQESPVDRLASRTHVEEERISREFYAFYRDVRIRLFDQLVRDNPGPTGSDPAQYQVRLLEHAQKIIDRVLFICFCEDTGLLPPDVIRRALTTASAGFVQITRWQQMVGLFEAVDQARPAMKINAYNGGLFAKVPELDALKVSDDSLDGILALAGYDFETDLNVNILGHIFEQSIADLEATRADIRGEAVDRGKSKRKQHGIFYTSEYIIRFIVARTIGGWLDQRFAELTATHYPAEARRSNAREQALYDDYFDVLKTSKVVDPACGSGAFLVAAFELSLEQYVDEHAYPVPWRRYAAAPWSLEPPEVDALMARIRERGVPLRDYTGVKPYRGVLTGLNEAFLIDDATRRRLIDADPRCDEVIKPYLRGQDIKRWVPGWAGLWMIVLKSSNDHPWPWADGGEGAEAIFASAYPALYAHVKQHEARLRYRSDKGRYWWELRSCDYYAKFEAPKIVYQEI